MRRLIIYSPAVILEGAAINAGIEKRSFWLAINAITNEETKPLLNMTFTEDEIKGIERLTLEEQILAKLEEIDTRLQGLAATIEQVIAIRKRLFAEMAEARQEIAKARKFFVS